jgi:hypothetical protein
MRVLDHRVPVTDQSFPGTTDKMPDPKPTYDKIPDEIGGHETTYKAAGKLKGRKALITGGDSGIGAATAVLFAREGADSTIVYLPVEELGAKCHLFSTDLTVRENCKKAVDFAIEKMGDIHILFNNAACELTRRCCGTGIG